MPKLHDDSCKSAILERLGNLGPGSERKWGRMSVGQMLWHVNEAMEAALGRVQLPSASTPLPRFLMKVIVINLPWPRGARTLPRWVATEEHNFSTERDRCVKLIQELTSRPLESQWPASPLLGPMTGKDVTRLHAKHLDHHLRQFGV